MPDTLSLFKNFVDLLIPHRCVRCGSIVENTDGLCTSCWPLIPFIVKPYCACCGFPFDFEIEEDALCGACSHTSPYFKRARSVFAYTSESKDLILKFKHADTINSGPLFAKWMSQSLDKIREPLCIPVPLHWTRLFIRTYNQAALLAQGIARLNHWSYAPSLLIRKHRTPSQGHLSRKDRQKNVERAFNLKKAVKAV